MSTLSMEFLKLKRSKLWLPILILPLLSILFGTGNYIGNREILQSEWVSLFTQVNLFYSMIFYPTLIGIIVAFIWHNEHKKNALKLMLSSGISPLKLIANKSLVAFLLSLLTQFYLLLLYSIVGSFLGFTTAFPWNTLLIALVITIFILPLIAFQSYLSLRIKSFATPVVFSLVLGLLGLFVISQSYFPILTNLFAFSKWSLFLNNPQSSSLSQLLGNLGQMSLFAILLIGVFSFLQFHQLQKQVQ